MKFQYQFNDEYHLMIWRQAIEVNVTFMKELIEHLHKLEKVKPPFNRFVDLSVVTGITLSFEDLARISHQRTEYHGLPVKSAFFSEQPLGYGIGRMYQAFMELSQVKVEVFKDIRSCASWLGVPLEVLKL